jgi:hypothetical protein
MDSQAALALAERLGEVIEEFSEANDIKVSEVLDGLEYTYACVERVNVHDEPRHKMH